jgi:uncharacterized OB-fold protein
VTAPASAIPLKDGLWTFDEEQTPKLIGSRCGSCGEVSFPRRQLGVCPNCQGLDIADLLLGPDAVVFSHTTVTQQPPLDYRGPVPYVLAWVELPDGVRLETLITADGQADITIGKRVTLVIRPLETDSEGNIVMTYMFEPSDQEIR